MAVNYDGMKTDDLFAIYLQMKDALQADPNDPVAGPALKEIEDIFQTRGEDVFSLYSKHMTAGPPPPIDPGHGLPINAAGTATPTSPPSQMPPAFWDASAMKSSWGNPPTPADALKGMSHPSPPPPAEPPRDPSKMAIPAPPPLPPPPEAPYPYGAPGVKPKNDSFDMTNLLPPFRPAGGVGKGSGAMSASPSIGGIGKTVGGAVESLGKVLGPEVEAVGKFITAIAGATDAVRDWIKGLHNANMEFAEFSGAMADVMSNQQNREIELAMQRGDRRADSAAELADAMHEMNREFARAEDAIAKDLNKIGAQLASILEVCMNIFNFIFQVDEDEKTADQGQTMAELHRMAGENDAPEKFGMPKWAR